MRIGIYTFWNVPNYGTFMQAYALRKAIQNLLPEDEVQQIAYLDPVHYAKYYKVVPREYKHPFIHRSFYRNVVRNLLSRDKITSRKKFLTYYKRIENTGALTKNEMCNTKFDAVVLGSDIIWDWSIGIFNQDEHLFGNCFNTENVISYACSFGTAKPGMAAPDYVKNGLTLQNNISVRDENSAELVREISGREAIVVADPTFLLDMDSDPNIPPRKIKDKYIVVYGSDFEPCMIDDAKQYAKKHNLKLVCLDSLDDAFDWCQINISQDDMDPFEWCSYFKYAEIIFTCTYHGLMFGLIFNKAIVFSPTQFIMDKVSSLMEYLEVKEPFVELKEFEKKADWNWETGYEKVINPKLNEMKEKSLQYLENALRR